MVTLTILADAANHARARAEGGMDNPEYVLFAFLGIIVAIIALVALWQAFAYPRHCAVCGIVPQNTKYQGKIDGRRVTMCPNCRNSIARRRSKQAVDAMFGDE